jgi:5-methylcytosine-specific restriction endonuclease McrA
VPRIVCKLFPRKKGYCNACGNKLIGRQTRWCSKKCNKKYAENHYWRFARKTAIKRDKKKCIKCGSKIKLEVNHIKPVLGKGYGKGCKHHLNNLETLCHKCHVEVTNQQRKNRKKKK